MLIDKHTNFAREKLSFNEIDEGFTTKEAIAEAKRCLNCPKPLCRGGCPIENEIPNFIQALAKGNVGEASAIIAQRSNLPAVCGRVCPHEKQCEGACILNKKNRGIQIGKLERFIADFDAEMGIERPKPVPSVQGKVAVIGSGPAGLTVAGDLAKLGFQVVIFESQAEAGGVLLYGIPEFRLSKEVVRREIKRIEDLGVEVKTGVVVGTDMTVDHLFADGFDAIFIGTGTALPRILDIPGKDLIGVIQATYLLRMVTLIRTEKIDRKETPINTRDKVVVVGAGNVAMDAARTALRLGASKVTVIYRRTEEEVTALPSEMEAAKVEGVEFQWLSNPTAILGAEQVTGLEYELQEIDENGKLRGTGVKKIIEADKIIPAIGQRPAARIVSTTEGIEVSDNGYVITRERPYGMTTRKGVFAGGDVVHQPATVVLAMKEAKKLAAGIAQYVEAKKLLENC
ncbi:NAD(P)-dependent oxidoreductase [Pelosinus propionicus]|uniref:Glutamate synthase (NADPH/NADH) small chain n=1 Tax=Pelosinus propionicus DSM 13327 TaxID=1123291 RepID=A0A1I4PRR7_9FIRM|nr:NAD(P)-dependent oxidoreductase [Pelosinus propionicus]SFM30429.1 glutamate synthase (NADPH/NADH) small chain [Pelosinus propionicus DSM 13327]